MKPVFALFLVLLATLCFSILYPTNASFSHESFIEGACSADTQTDIQNSVNKILQQPIINSDNMVVDSVTAYNDVKKVVGNGKYSSCDQSKDLQKIIDKNPQPEVGLPALKSYYTTKDAN